MKKADELALRARNLTLAGNKQEVIAQELGVSTRQVRRYLSREFEGDLTDTGGVGLEMSTEDASRFTERAWPLLFQTLEKLERALTESEPSMRDLTVLAGVIIDKIKALSAQVKTTESIQPPIILDFKVTGSCAKGPDDCPNFVELPLPPKR